MVAVWRCGPLSLQIDVNVDDSFYVRASDRDSHTLREWYEGAFPYTAIQGFLRDLSRRTAKVNPEWHRLYE